LEKFIENYLKYRKTLGFSPATLEIDGRALRKFHAYLKTRQLSFAGLTTQDLKNYQSYLIASLQPIGAYKYYSVLACFYRNLYRRQQILFNPCRDLEPIVWKRPLPRNIPSQEQLEKFLELPDLTTKLGLRDRALFELVYSTGLRLSEITGLDLDDLDFKNRLVRVRGKGNKERFVPLGKTAAFYLIRYLGVPPPAETSAVFLSSCAARLSKNTMSERLKKTYLPQLGIKFTMHSLRHACALHLLQNKAGIRHIQELLGHTDLSTTQIYTRLLPLDLKQAHAAGHPREKEARNQ